MDMIIRSLNQSGSYILNRNFKVFAIVVSGSILLVVNLLVINYVIIAYDGGHLEYYIFVMGVRI